MSTSPGTDGVLTHFLGELSDCLEHQRRLEAQAARTAGQRTRLVTAIRSAIETLEPEHRTPWRTRLRALIGPDVQERPNGIPTTTDRMRLVRHWLSDEAPDPFRNANLKDAMARHGHEIRHSQIGTILTRLAERGEIERVGHGMYRVVPGHSELRHRCN